MSFLAGMPSTVWGLKSEGKGGGLKAPRKFAGFGVPFRMGHPMDQQQPACLFVCCLFDYE